jgi:hypothetical protein
MAGSDLAVNGWWVGAALANAPSLFELMGTSVATSVSLATNSEVPTCPLTIERDALRTADFFQQAAEKVARGGVT